MSGWVCGLGGLRLCGLGCHWPTGPKVPLRLPKGGVGFELEGGREAGWSYGFQTCNSVHQRLLLDIKLLVR